MAAVAAVVGAILQVKRGLLYMEQEGTSDGFHTAGDWRKRATIGACSGT